MCSVIIIVSCYIAAAAVHIILIDADREIIKDISWTN